MDLIADGLDQAVQDVRGDLARDLLMQFDEGELRRPVDRDDEVELALSDSPLSDVDVEGPDRVGLRLCDGFGVDLRQARDPMTLKAAMRQRTRQTSFD